MYKWIKMTPEAIGLYVPMLVIAIFIGWPFVDKAIIKATGSKTLPVVIGLAGMVFVTLLMIFEALP
jgi:hypothetical protein